jgi:phosphate transport system protein
MSDHTVTAFDKELGGLHRAVVEMGDLTCRQLDGVLDAVEGSDSGVAAQVIEREPEADRRERDIEDVAVRVLALRQPVADDLRAVLAALRIANELERICDYAEDLAERVIALRSSGAVPLRSLGAVGRFAAKMVRDGLRAYAEANAQAAQDVWSRDKTLDEMYTNLFRELLTHMIEDPRRISAATHMLFMARAVERVGDRATNIAEMVRYLVGGVVSREEREKANSTKSMMLQAKT